MRRTSYSKQYKLSNITDQLRLQVAGRVGHLRVTILEIGDNRLSHEQLRELDNTPSAQLTYRLTRTILQSRKGGARAA